LKNSYKPSKTLLQYNFLVPPNEEGLVLNDETGEGPQIS